jgi:5-methylcytosine-specific restriction endonuclease McrA
MSNRFLEARLIALERDNYTCQYPGCGQKLAKGPGKNVVHHKNYTSDEPENLVSLCVKHHVQTHAEKDIEKRPTDTRIVKLEDDTYWLLRAKRDKMAKEEERAVTFDDVVNALLSRSPGGE